VLLTLRAFHIRRSSDLEMIHGLRRAELINLLDNSRMPVKHAFNPFRKPDSRVIEPVLFDIDELHVRVTPVSVVRHNWAIAPVDRSEEHTSELQSRENLV